MVYPLERPHEVVPGEELVTALQALSRHRPVSIPHQSVRLRVGKCLLILRELSVTRDLSSPHLVDQLDWCLHPECVHTNCSHPRMGQIDVANNVVHHLHALAEVDVLEELRHVPDGVVPGWCLDKDLVLVSPGVFQWHDEHARLVAPLLLSDDEGVDHVDAHVVATNTDQLYSVSAPSRLTWRKC